MKAQTIRYVAPKKVDIVDVEVGDPAPDEVQVQVKACGICAWDTYTYVGGPEVRNAAPPGHEAVGVVAAVGADVTDLKVGDPVCGGGFQSVANHKADGVRKLPVDEVKDFRHWVVEPVQCVVNGLDRAGLYPGDRVAVIGCGFMGLLHVQGLAHSMISRLIGVDVNPKKLELAGRCGAPELYHPVDDAAALEKMHGQFDVVIEVAGAQPALDLAVNLLRPAGRLSLFSWHHGPRQVDAHLWHIHGLEIRNSSPVSGPVPARFTEGALRLLAAGKFDLEPLVTHSVPLTGLSDLLAQVADGDDTYVKGVVTYD